MSCLTVTIGKPSLGAVHTGTPYTGCVSASGIDTGWFSCRNVTVNPDISTRNVGGMKLNMFLVCSTGLGNYLLVRPEEVQYIWVDNSIDYDIRSNTDWNIH